jgi:hypothetical protein
MKDVETPTKSPSCLTPREAAAYLASAPTSSSG